MPEAPTSPLDRPQRRNRRHPGRDHQEAFANDETDAGEVRGFPEGTNAVTALSGQVDAVLIDQAVAADPVEKQGGMEIAEEIATDEFFGYAMAKGAPLVAPSTALCSAQGRRHDRGSVRAVLRDRAAGRGPHGTNDTRAD